LCVAFSWLTTALQKLELESDYTSEVFSAMHTIHYCTLPLAFSDSDRISSHRPLDYSTCSKRYPDEFILVEGRPGKENGVFEISMYNLLSLVRLLRLELQQ
jgi:hypothetical protein